MYERKELVDMIDSMNEEQFTQFFIKAIQDPETRAAVVGILESAGLLGGGEA
nr:MAG TPA: Cas system-associated protein [Caudoviricetes sp.]